MTAAADQSTARAASGEARKLGDYLPVSQEQIERVIGDLAARGDGAKVEANRLGDALVKAGVVTREQLLDALTAQRVDRLRQCHLFASLTGDDLAKLSTVVHEKSVPMNEQFIDQDTLGHSMFVIAAGRVMVYRRTEEGDEIPLGAAWPGETIGEMGYFSDGTRSASARALENVQLLEIAYDDLPRAFELIPNLARDFLRVVTKRLRETNVRYQANVNKRRVVERSLRHLSAYLDLSADLSIGADIEALIDRVVKSASKVMQADRASLFLVDPVTGDLWSKVAEGAETREIRVPAGSGIAGWVAQHGDTLNIADAYDDERFNKANDLKTGYRTRSILCGPVQNMQGEIIGVVQVINKDTGKFTREDETLFKAFSHQAAIAVENFNLYRRLVASNEKMAILLDVANAVSQTLDLPPLIRMIVEKIAEIVNCERSSFFVLDRDTAELWSMEAHGSTLKEIRFPVTAGLAGACAREAAPINVRDAHEDARFNPDFDKKTGFRTRSVLCVPVFDRDGKTVTGVTQAINKIGGESFEEGDVELLKAISAQIAVAVDNAQLYARTVNMKNYLESVRESITNGILTLDTGYKVVTANASALRTLERRLDEVVGSDLRAVLPDGNANERLLGIVEKVYRDHRLADEDDVEFSPAQGKTCTVNARAVPLTDQEGNEQGQVLVLDDVTQERRVKNTLTRFMSRDIAEKLLTDGEQKLGGVSSKATVLFSDIREFTTISEGLAAERVMDFLNQYFTLMVDEVIGHKGVLDKYMGDALMAVFGVPYPADDDAVRAVRCALAMTRALDAFNARRIEQKLPVVQMGIGINTDVVVSGRMGSAKRMEYTVIGDGVNTASRLEGLTKQYASRILITESTMREIGEQFYVREVDHVRVKGKTRPVGIYEVLGDAAYKPTAEQKLFLVGYESYCQRQFNDAREAFYAGAKSDALCGIFLTRCDEFLKTPPPADWDGVWRMTSK